MLTNEVVAEVVAEVVDAEDSKNGVIPNGGHTLEPSPMSPTDRMLLNRAAEQPMVFVNGVAFAISCVIEALLFVADGPVEIDQIAKTVNVDRETIYQGLQQLDQYYQTFNRGMRVQEYSGKFQLVTRPGFASVIEAFLNLDLNTKLSAPALETLAIVAYRQPITRAQIEAVRGVDSSAILRSLVQRALIQESGRLAGMGRPILYSVTETFMLHFGLTGLNELPALATTEADTLWAATMLAENQACGTT